MKLTSALTGATYERTEDGLVLVTEKDGRTGLFQADGRHVSGELRYADPHMIDWLAMPQAQGMGRLAALAASADESS
jgi:hypothetical protein